MKITRFEDNEDLLTFMWLMSVTDAEGSYLTLDQSIPSGLRDDWVSRQRGIEAPKKEHATARLP